MGILKSYPQFIEIAEQFHPNDELSLHSIVNSIALDNMNAIEIGSWCGHSSIIIADIVKANKGMLYCIDRWEVYEDVPDSVLNKHLEENDIFNIFRKNIKTFKFKDYIIPIVSDSSLASKMFCNNFADFIFIDADHRYSGIKKDILNYWPKLKVGGILCGHDYDNNYLDIEELVDNCEIDYYKKHHCGVIRAVNELFGNTVTRMLDTIWYVEKYKEELNV